MKTKSISASHGIAYFLLVGLLFVTASCAMLQAGAEPEGAPQPGAAGNEPGGREAGGIGLLEVGLEPPPLPDQVSYQNAAYGFAFDYPETWTLHEEDHAVILRKGPVRLTVHYRRADEEGLPRYFGRTGVGAGDFIYAGKVNFLGQVIPVQILLHDKKPKAVYYNGTDLVAQENLVFMIVLEDLDTDYQAVDLPDEIIGEANAVVESFARPGAGGGALEADAGLQVILEAPDPVELGSGEAVRLHFVLKNNSAEPLYLLKWYTPFEGITGHIFDVFHDGEPVPYQGPLVSRSNPAPDSYLLLEPGGSKSTHVDLTGAYDFSQPGIYTIRYRSPEISHIARSEAQMAASLNELGPVNIPSNQVKMEIPVPLDGNHRTARLDAEAAAVRIAGYLLEQNPGLMEAPPLAVEELLVDAAWEKLQAQLFLVTSELYRNEAFLLGYDRVVQLTMAAGGEGLTSAALADLDQDGRWELVFTYSGGLSPDLGGGVQTRVAIYAPASGSERPIQAYTAYRGTAALLVESPTGIYLYTAEFDETTRELRYLDRLGSILLENSAAGTALDFQPDPDLSPDLQANLLRPE